MSITVNGADILSMTLTMPAVGTWTLSAELATDDVISGAIKVENENVSLSGYVLPGRSGVVAGVCMIEAIGGKGGLVKALEARSYQSAKAREVIGDLMASAGESLDPGTARGVLDYQLAYWTRAGGRAGTALTVLAEALGARWRVRSSGGIWIGAEAWPKVAEDYGALELDRDHAAGSVLLAPDTIALAPGVLLEGERVGRVEHSVGRDSELRTVFWLED